MFLSVWTLPEVDRYNPGFQRTRLIGSGTLPSCPISLISALTFLLPSFVFSLGLCCGPQVLCSAKAQPHTTLAKCCHFEMQCAPGADGQVFLVSIIPSSLTCELLRRPLKTSRQKGSCVLSVCYSFLMHREVQEADLTLRILWFCCFRFPFVETSLWQPGASFRRPSTCSCLGQGFTCIREEVSSLNCLSLWRRCGDTCPVPVDLLVSPSAVHSWRLSTKCPQSTLFSWWMVPFITTRWQLTSLIMLLSLTSVHTVTLSHPRFSVLCISWQIDLC